jgi:hypothetical protein
MSDYDLDKIDAAFGRLRGETTILVKPQGIAAARWVARRRRNVRMAAFTALALVLITSAVGYAGFAGGKTVPTAHPSPSTPDASWTSGRPLPVQTSRGRVGFCPPPSVKAPPGGMTETTLCNGTLPVPAWPAGTACASGPLKFTNGVHLSGASSAVTLGTVDGRSGEVLPLAYDQSLGDGSVATIVEVNCEGGGFEAPGQVIVLRVAPDGSVETLGAVVGMAEGAMIKAFGVQGDGDISVDLIDYDPPVGQQQTRTYRWTGKVFIQVAGPTSFPPNPHTADLSVTATDLFMTSAGHTSSGWVTVTVHDHGPGRGAYELSIDVPGWTRPAKLPTGCIAPATWDPAGYPEITCDATIVNGASHKFAIHLTASSNAAVADSSGGTQAQVHFLGLANLDPNSDNDSATFQVNVG